MSYSGIGSHPTAGDGLKGLVLSESSKYEKIHLILIVNEEVR